MNAATFAIYLLIALVKTPGEGGTVMIEYQSLAECEAGGAALENQLEGIQLDPKADGTIETNRAKVYHTCMQAPSQR